MNPEVKQDPSITLALPLTSVNYLLTILGDRPLKEVRNLSANIESQARTALAELDRKAAGAQPTGLPVVEEQLPDLPA